MLHLPREDALAVDQGHLLGFERGLECSRVVTASGKEHEAGASGGGGRGGFRESGLKRGLEEQLIASEE